jgi:hypothetical protein
VDNDTGGNTWTHGGHTGSRKGARFYKRLTNSSAGKVVTIAGCQNSASGGIDVLRGVYLTGDPTSNFSTRQLEAADTKQHAGFTPTHADSFIRMAVFEHTNDGTGIANMTCTDPGSLEPEFFLATSQGGDDCETISTGAPQVGGPTSTGQFSWSQSLNQCHVMVWSLRPEPSAATEPPSSTSQNPIHTYASAGTYRVTLKVTDSLGRTASFSNSTVTVAP